ncbi:MAG: sulfotransferase domain-containing protein [Nitrosomonadales bacterium]|nr:sulfotransferase domain-containing protein [Nitrosomonadales bacterium]
MDKTFLLGVGSQKAGTTWLYKFLNGHPCTDMGFAKEYHVFDALYVPACSYIIENRMREANELYCKGVFPFDSRSPVFRLLDFCGNPDNYFNYFRDLVNRDTNVLLTGDITPSYSGLPVEALQLIKAGLEGRGFRVRVILIMRDPIDRCISAARLHFKMRGLLPSADEENALLRDVYDSEGFRIRTRYDMTIRNLESVFSGDQIAYSFYESLFNASSIRRLAEFLSIPLEMPDFTYNPNPSRAVNQIDESLKRAIFETYRPVYDFVRDRFGTEAVRCWHQY